MFTVSLRRFAGAVLITVGAVLVTSHSGVSAKASVKGDQCANLGTTCDTTHTSQWVDGAVNESKADYAEGDSLPYRAVFSGLTVDETYSLQIAWDTTKAGKHALDFLTTYDRTETTADPCSGYVCSSPTSTLAIPSDPNIPAGIQIAGQVFTAFGATFPADGSVVANSGDLCGTATCTIVTNPGSYVLDAPYTGDSTTRIRLYFTAKAATVVIAWAGHIASRMDWGIDASAATINGSPYHTMFDDFDCSDASNCNVGAADMALASAAVVIPASITVVKSVPATSGTSFPYTAGPAPLSNFDLVDDGTAANTRTFSGITDFTVYTVNEGSVSGWQLDTAICSVEGANGGSRTVDGAVATIDLREGEHVTCTYSNARTPVPGLDIAKTADPVTYAAVDDQITYTYVLTNTGQTVLGPTQFTVDDDHINSGAPFNCGPASTTLAIGGTVSCTATYSVTLTDVEGGSVVNAAFGAGAGQTTRTVQATATYEAVSTTLGETTTTAGNGTTTTLSETTTTAGAAVTTTTIEDEFFIIFPEEFPNSGGNDGLYLGLGTATMLLGFLILVASFEPRRRLSVVQPMETLHDTSRDIPDETIDETENPS